VRLFVSYTIAFFLILTFLSTLPHLLPGDPLELYYNDPIAEVPPALLESLRARYGLDKPIYEQVLTSLKNIFVGELGYSLVEQEEVSHLLWDYGRRSLFLVVPAFLFSALIGFIFGMEAGTRKDSPFDRLGLFTFIGLGALPPMVSGGVLLYLFYYRFFPGGVTSISGSGPLEVFQYLVLPTLTLIVSHVTLNFLLTRNNVVFLLKEPFVLALQAKEVGNTRIKYLHLARNILPLWIQRLAVSLGTLLTAGIVVEVVFHYPGLGSLLQEAILSRDYPLINGIILLLTMSVLGFNLAADLINKRLGVRE